MCSKEKILLYGGAFDPIHNGHTNTIKYCLKHLVFDQIWLLLTFKNVDGKQLSWWKYRYEMIKIALLHDFEDQDLKKIKVCLFEIGKGDSVTLKTIQELKKINTNHEYSFLMGDDTFIKLNDWANYKKFIHECEKIYILNRGLTETLTFHPLINNLDFVDKFEVLKNPPWVISSTEIKNGQNLQNLHPKVLEYCNNNGLYFYQRIKSYLSPHRIEHSFNVASLAVELAKQHDVSVNDCYCAAILHDIAKELPASTLNWYLKVYDENHLNTHPSVQHQYVVAVIAKNKFLINNQKVLDAIAQHTIPDFSKPIDDVTKIVYLADKLSEDRDFSNIKYYRDLAKRNLNLSFVKLFEFIQSQYEDINTAKIAEDSLIEEI
ncbi:bis(5'-nucleosyl)-tetraphosphatase (symmetrical) YqeK [Mycoplasma sp. SG1]|uniref:bis(5'-nucleosyl)-tetraphosphatase (symmetrical) YqeK n=1 Tax=Mycoplasma sp. SG1 TaxID=2810348 RepID=UPI002025AEC2|nr:bis(5'-nucleosyl)-tetraphosphatase (symmetrical) YqeK [Mycoplasma sp. SG1]URM53075.1 bis(5'-nucleosyl)-tetraphosphatase (symmetrical) YqeK [Mycoplasma sp. SG1]